MQISREEIKYFTALPTSMQAFRVTRRQKIQTSLIIYRPPFGCIQFMLVCKLFPAVMAIKN